MFTSMQRANQLRERYSSETGTKYDVVVTVRPDIALYRPLDLDAFLVVLAPADIANDETTRTRYAAFGPSPLILNDLRGLPATDLLFFARPEVMTRVLKLADDVDQYRPAGRSRAGASATPDEHLLHRHRHSDRRHRLHSPARLRHRPLLSVPVDG